MRASARARISGPVDIDGLLRHAAGDTPPSDGLAQIRTRRRVVTARSPMQGAYMQAFDAVDLVFGLGPAGTGKTYLAVAFAAQCLERGEVERIVLSRPAVEAGERLGFLPGDLKEKVDPYLRPLYDALYDLLPPAKVERDLATGVIEIAPLAFMRGRTLAHSFVILDEAQNSTSMQMKMFLTRIGEGSKMAITGDPSQVDLPTGQRSGLEEAVTLLRRRRGYRSGALYLGRRRPPRPRGPDRRRLRQSEVGRIARMSAPGDSTPSICTPNPPRSPNHRVVCLSPLSKSRLTGAALITLSTRSEQRPPR